MCLSQRSRLAPICLNVLSSHLVYQASFLHHKPKQQTKSILNYPVTPRIPGGKVSGMKSGPLSATPYRRAWPRTIVPKLFIGWLKSILKMLRLNLFLIVCWRFVILRLNWILTMWKGVLILSLIWNIRMSIIIISMSLCVRLFWSCIRKNMSEYFFLSFYYFSNALINFK